MKWDFLSDFQTLWKQCKICISFVFRPAVFNITIKRPFGECLTGETWGESICHGTIQKKSSNYTNGHTHINFMKEHMSLKNASNIVQKHSTSL